MANKYTIGTIASVLGAIAGIILAWGTIRDKVVYSFLDSYLEQRKGGFRSEIAKGLEIPVENVVPYVVNIIWEAQKTIEVGLYVNAETGRLWYIHTDGEEYQPIWDANSQRHYFIDKDNNSIWCQ